MIVQNTIDLAYPSSTKPGKHYIIRNICVSGPTYIRQDREQKQIALLRVLYVPPLVHIYRSCAAPLSTFGKKNDELFRSALRCRDSYWTIYVSHGVLVLVLIASSAPLPVKVKAHVKSGGCLSPVSYTHLTLPTKA